MEADFLLFDFHSICIFETKLDCMKRRYKIEVIIPLILVFLSMLIVLLSYDKTQIHLTINAWNGAFRDLGDGLFALIVIVLALFVKFRFAIMFAFSYLISALIVQGLKHGVFSEAMRPVRFFQETDFSLHLVDGVHQHSYLTFPSGHLACAFAVFIWLALLIKRPVLAVFFVLVALMVAFSRIYLSQHFLLDVFVGSMLGSAAAFLAYYWVRKWNPAWLNRSLLSFKDSKLRKNES